MVIRQLFNILKVSLVITAVSACKDSDDYGSEVDILDNTPPEVTITFPPSVNTSTDRNNITIRGTAHDVNEIAMLRINGIDVNSTDSFSNWDVTVPLEPGANSLTFETSDSAGNTDLAAAETILIRSPQLVSPVGVALDIANDHALVIDDSINALVAVELDTGLLRVVSDSSTGTGPDIEFPSSVALNTENNRALITDRTLKALFEVDLISGDRTLLSNESTGDGPVFSWPRSVAVDSLGNRALVVDTLLRTLVAVDLSNGNRVVISDNNGIGNGLTFGQLNSVTFDEINNRALIIDSGWGVLFGVDLVTGDRTVLSGVPLAAPFPLTGTGPGFSNPQSLTLDAVNNRALVINPLNTNPSLMAVDLTTGDRTVLADNSLASGPDFGWPVALVLDADNNRVLVADSRRSELLAVNLTTREGAAVSNSGIGDGPKFYSLRSFSLDTANRRAVVSDRLRHALISVDLITGDRSIVSKGDLEMVSHSDRGEGMRFTDLEGVAIDIDHNRILAISSDEDTLNSMVMAIDLESGDRAIISDTNTFGTTIGIGSGAPFYPRTLALDPTNNSLVVDSGDGGFLLLVDLATGDRIEFSNNSGLGDGANFDRIYSIALDSVNNRVLLVDLNLKAVFEVDLDSGDRAVVSASNIGTGPDFDLPVSLAWDATNNRVVVADVTHRALLAADMNNGDRTMLSGDNVGNGPNFDCPNSVVLDTENHHAFVADSCLNALFAVHLDSGDRVIISR